MPDLRGREPSPRTEWLRPFGPSRRLPTGPTPAPAPRVGLRRLRTGIYGHGQSGRAETHRYQVYKRSRSRPRAISPPANPDRYALERGVRGSNPAISTGSAAISVSLRRRLPQIEHAP